MPRDFNQDLNQQVSFSSMLISFSFPSVDLHSQDISKAYTIKYIFYKALVFNGNVTNWNASEVTDMFYVFREAATFYQDLNSQLVISVDYVDFIFMKQFHLIKIFAGTLVQEVMKNV